MQAPHCWSPVPRALQALVVLVVDLAWFGVELYQAWQAHQQ